MGEYLCKILEILWVSNTTGERLPFSIDELYDICKPDEIDKEELPDINLIDATISMWHDIITQHMEITLHYLTKEFSPINHKPLRGSIGIFSLPITKLNVEKHIAVFNSREREYYIIEMQYQDEHRTLTIRCSTDMYEMDSLIAHPEKVWHHRRVKFNSVISYNTAYVWWCITYQRSPEEVNDECEYWWTYAEKRNLELKPINPPAGCELSSDEWEFIYTGSTILK